MKYFFCVSIILIIIFLIAFGIGIIIQPPWATDLLQFLYPEAIIHFDRNCIHKAVVLTFDDSFSSSTDDLIELLEHHNSTATFFLMGQKMEHLSENKSLPKLYQKLLDNGHDVGNHMHTYDPACKMDKTEFFESVNKTDKMIISKLLKNNKRKWFRPASFIAFPYMFPIIKEMNYTMVLGSVHSFDVQVPNTLYNLLNLVGRIQTGDIIILHDVGDMMEYIEYFIVYLKYKGFEIVSMSKMMELCPLGD